MLHNLHSRCNTFGSTPFTLVSSLIVAVLLSFLVAVANATTAEEYLNAQINWIQSRGGYYSPKIKYRNLDENDPTSPLGMFLSDAVDDGETLMLIPKECLVTTGKTVAESTDTCDTVKNLARLYELGDSSEYYPYVSYCFDKRHAGDLPSTWSKEGKNLIELIVGGNELFPNLSMTAMTFEYVCGGDAPSPLEQDAYHHVLRRSWDDIMIPVFDMVNHRNGKWKNVDSNSAHEENDINVFASRHIAKGEQLYLSYNECMDCDDYAHTYVLQHILRDYGFVEQYPRRWNLFGNELMFQLEEKEDHGGGTYRGSASHLKLAWLGEKGPPGKIQAEEGLPYLFGHLRRVKNIDLANIVKNLPSDHEQYTVTEFYSALVMALEHVIWYLEDIISDDNIKSEIYDELDDKEEYMLSFHEDMCEYERVENYEMIDKFDSFYQEITFWRNEKDDDICMRLDGHLESCERNRAHYHETLVHYAASYIENVKRVMFLGGGDSMILYEALKYPSLELVVGLELDKGVCDRSFKNFETQPHFDNDMVEWWFGDASKSLRLLPEEYIGSFDLILVDLQTDIVAATGIMDMVSLFSNDHGIIIRNEDRGFGTNHPFARHSVDLYSDDVPLFCRQGITMGSNSVDFTTAPRTEHNISTLYYASSAQKNNRFDMWYNYRKMEALEIATETPPKGLDSVKPSPSKPNGILMVLELEKTASEISDSIISSALEQAGFSLKPSQNMSSSEVTDINSVTTKVFFIDEGYVIARGWPDKRYAAFDIMLWSGYEKMYSAERELAAILGSSTSSSYRIVTSGMTNVKKAYTSIKPDTCSIYSTNTPDRSGLASKEDSRLAVEASIKTLLANVASPEVLVLCGDQHQPCSVLDVVQKISGTKALTVIYACPVSESNFTCESRIRGSTRALIEAGRRLDSIIIDPETPRQSGQIMNKILGRAELRGQLLADKFVAIGTSIHLSTSSWLRLFMERFRTDFVKYNPSFHAEVYFNDTVSSLGMNIYSSGNPHFYEDLVQVISSTERRTKRSSDVKYVHDGLNNYVADFSPSRIFTHGDYDTTSAKEQWKTQQPLGRQTIVQFKANAEPSEYSNKLRSGLKKVLSLMNIKKLILKGATQVREYAEVGDGTVIIALWSECSAVVMYDGESQLTLNLFTQQPHEVVHRKFEELFIQSIPSIDLQLRDTHPRGLGRVISFP